jgi:hypothetical protein
MIRIWEFHPMVIFGRMKVGYQDLLISCDSKEQIEMCIFEE